ncbi:methylated-DNA--protein-cysteine methyltransferase [Lysobacter sp. HDW10]|jgi:methylated-DNA-protein-cysteine methyltransferase-like protein|uniref:MGMT family protein n=1 Tax=Lysobacter sp. HDW10 TaxID=2714936 RepID=UPI001409A167|nr:MGMT family protein [Lysobacter sp. HDW10]QIK81344.1 methylated-DNA--protein-cysteine methyltransferase [Lysobacter sp. HDW10]
MDSADEAKVWKVIRAIPAGTVLGYGEVGRLAGFPKRARWVAKLLASKTPAGLPWHRVLRSDGKIAFAEGSSGYERQLAALKKEGVEVRNGRVLKKRVVTEDEHLWGPPV